MAEIELSNAEKKVLRVLGEKGGKCSPEDIFSAGGFNNIVEVMSASSWLKQKGLVDIEEKVVTSYSLSPEGIRYSEVGLPERRLLTKEAALTEDERKYGTTWVKQKGLAEIKKDKETGKLVITPTEKGTTYISQNKKTPDEDVLSQLKDGEKPDTALNPIGLEMLKKRKDVLKSKNFIQRMIIITDKGRAIVDRGIGDIEDEISQITPEHIQQHQKGQTLKFRKYHVESFAPALRGGRKHPLRELMNEVREVFVEMGFTEIEYDYVQPCFWNMDALFIPQDHPARDIQDTFYLKSPEKIPITDRALAEKIRAIHENGGNTGSDGWKYKWSDADAEKAVLRTHTTVNTIRYLSEHPEPPVKVFSVGRIFRNEATDATHLSELYQIEGIVMEERASLAMLIGTLKEFYRRMGFPDVMVTTSYYPYTEPSMDVAVKFRGRILELGGAGIFRPEVTAPFGVKHNVLAWGLGLERLAMIKWGVKDIRGTISNDLGFLAERKMIR